MASKFFQHAFVRVVADLEHGPDDLVAAWERQVVESLHRVVECVWVVVWNVRLAVRNDDHDHRVLAEAEIVHVVRRVEELIDGHVEPFVHVPEVTRGQDGVNTRWHTTARVWPLR